MTLVGEHRGLILCLFLYLGSTFQLRSVSCRLGLQFYPGDFGESRIPSGF